MLEYIKRLPVDVATLEDLITAEAIAVLVKERFEGLDIRVPQELIDKVRQIRRAITIKVEEMRAKELHEVRMQLDRLTPDSEKRRKLLEREKELKPLVEADV